ncbi:MAG: glycerol-3-phosphate 1-O-acyltransferase PlsY [Desulfobacterales bacterium]|nr:glycerol-3-phosphate 1-O-acyltransferase PlsY [Desulfobacterales bacterium]
MEISNAFKLTGLLIFSYLIGSIPWGLVLTRLFSSTDIRRQGSGNIGATNVRRVAGQTLGIITLIADILKGALPVFFAQISASGHSFRGQIYIATVAVCAFSGHLFPIYLKFKNGGKGVATAAGCFLVLSPIAGLIAILVFIMIICWSNRASAGSLAASAALPFAVWKVTYSQVFTGCAILITLLIYFRHIDNIRRLISGAEPVIWKKK